MLILQLRPSQGRGSRSPGDPRGQANVAYLRVRPSDTETLIVVEVQYLTSGNAVAIGFRADRDAVLIARSIEETEQTQTWREGK